MRVVGIELGGTKSIAVLAEGAQIIETIAVPTRGPWETLSALRAQIDRWREDRPITALGIASFGPVQLDRTKVGYGTLLATPKPGWSGAPVAEVLAGNLHLPWTMDTDVNGAALAEYRWGAGAGCDVLCYVTIGTGLGGGVLVDGRPVHGAMHPEIGHLQLRRAQGDAFAGSCAFHGDCIEGLVCGPALAARFGVDAANALDADPCWLDVASDIAELCGAILLSISAKRILFGGSVAINRPFLFASIRQRAVARWGDYLPFLNQFSADEIIQVARLGAQAGPLGAIALAEFALDQNLA
jgi:fructokinase